MDIELREKNSAAVVQAMAILAASAMPDVHWIHGDDLCDCTFQRIGEWTNPYLAQTLRVRLCCIWRELYKMFPEYVQEIDAYYDYNRHKWIQQPAQWNSDELDMPVGLWFRQLAKKEGKSLAEIRAEYGKRKHERPKKVDKCVEDAISPEELAAARKAQMKAGGWII